jgi:PAS domain S-box-containing protein
MMTGSSELGAFMAPLEALPIWAAIGLVLMLAWVLSSKHWRSKRAAKVSLDASAARFKAISEASPLGMALYDAKSKEQLWRNERFAKLERDGLDKTLGGHAWQDMALSDTSPVVAFSRDFIRADGTMGAARIHTARVKGDAGEPMLVALVEDATQSKMARVALEASKRKFELVFKLSPLPMVILERRSGLIMEVNEAFCSLFGEGTQRWHGKTIAGSRLMPDGFDAAELWSEMVEGKGVEGREAKLLGADGAELICTLSATEMDWGQSFCFALCAVDISAQRAAQAEVKLLNMELEERARLRGEQLALARGDLERQERLASLGALVAGIAHEINTPIGNGLTVATTLVSKTIALGRLAESGKMRREDLGNYLNEAIECSKLIERNMGAASELVSSFKQVSVDQSSSKRRSFDLARCARDTCATLAPSLRKAGIDLALQIEPGLIMDSYPGAIGQALINLVNNALMHGYPQDFKKAAREQELHVKMEPQELVAGRIEIGARQAAPGWIELWVQDDGLGVAGEDSARIFDPFFSTKFGQGGSGLGLSIVHALARDALGGSIELAPSVKGARFVLKMPQSGPKKHGES